MGMGRFTGYTNEAVSAVEVYNPGRTTMVRKKSKLPKKKAATAKGKNKKTASRASKNSKSSGLIYSIDSDDDVVIDDVDSGGESGSRTRCLANARSTVELIPQLTNVTPKNK